MKIADLLKLWLEKWASDIIVTWWAKPSLKINWDVYFLDNIDPITRDESKEMVQSIMKPHQVEYFFKNLELDFGIELKGFCRFRVNAFSQNWWYSLVFRPIKNEVPSFEDLNLPDIIRSFTYRRNGLFLVTWSVGSWKTTTLASLVSEINKNQSKHIITIEDPIEFIFENENSIIEQREVWVHTRSFDNWLKYSLRQAPDVIMIWELRDLETFRLALRARETWNLVLGTLHTSWARRSVSRIIDMFPWEEKDLIRQQLSESLLGVIWQQLLKTKSWDARVPAVEVLVNNISVANIIRKNQTHQLSNAMETGRDAGMITMKESLDKLYKWEFISQDTYDAQLKLIDRYN